MRLNLNLLLVICITIWFTEVKAQTISEKVTSECNIVMTINNLGIIGNAFNGSYVANPPFPSCRYPKSSDIEHLFTGGLWVGGLKQGQPVVTTGAFEAGRGYSVGGANFEFVAPFGSVLQERSSLISKQDLYSPAAISHQDFISEFTDTAFRGVVPGTQFPIPGYNPLGLSVKMETYNWNFPYSNFFVILNFRIINVGQDSIVNPYVGYWADGAVRNVRVSPPGTTNFFGTGGNAYIDSLNAVYEYDATGDTASTRSYMAIKYLGATDAKGFRYPLPYGNPAINQDFKCNKYSWRFRGIEDFQSPNTEALRYDRMSSSITDRPNWNDLKPIIAKNFNGSNLISAGPFTTLYPGDTINATFAIVLADRVLDGFPPEANTGTQLRNLISGCQYVQAAFNGNDRNYDGLADSAGARLQRFLLPTPPAIPNTKVVARDNAVDIYWNKEAENSRDRITGLQDIEGYRIYKTKFGYDVQAAVDENNAFEIVAEFDKAGNNLFYNTGFSKIALGTPEVIDGDTMFYKYTINKLQNGWQHVVALETFDGGNPRTNLPSLATGPLNNLFRVFPGKTANADMKKTEPFVYPNPYYGEAAWEGIATTRPEDKKLYFANLPKRCVIRVFTMSGDLVDVINHDQAYNGSDIKSFSNPNQTVFSGGEHAWDLLSSNNQIISRGLYMFTVEDLESKKTFRGNFTIIK
jgi:hypothetical protein